MTDVPVSGPGLPVTAVGVPAPANAVPATATTHPLVVTDLATLPDEPAADSWYHHRFRLRQVARDVWAGREIVLTLAERDLRVTYKEAVLGFAWALLSPLATLVVMTLVFKRVKGFQVGHVPYILYVFTGMLAWQFFSQSLSAGGSSLLANKPLLAKVHFPRECFPLSQILEAAVNTTFAMVILVALFVIHGYAPHVQALWIPLLLPIEVVFTIGVVLAVSALLVHVRDLTQVVPIVIQIGMFATPVVWPFAKLPAPYRPAYAFFNPLGPVIDSVRRTLLLGQSPDWGLVAVGAAGAAAYLVLGTIIFKRLEADLADIA